MARVRKISTTPSKENPNYFLVDACFLVEKYIPIKAGADQKEIDRKNELKLWRTEIDRQINLGKARVYVPDICIAEAFKVLAKKYYRERIFKSSANFRAAKIALSDDITTSHKELKKHKRHIRYHDLPTTRDVIIAVDRFYELFMKHNHNVGVIDLLIVASAKYLMDFHDAQHSQIHIITLDNALWKGTKKITELPNAYNPTEKSDAFHKVFL